MKSNETPLERLEIAIRHLKVNDRKLSNSEITLQLGFKTPNYLSSILSGSAPVSDSFLEKLDSVYGISANWINTGKGMMIPEENFLPVIRKFLLKVFKDKKIDDDLIFLLAFYLHRIAAHESALNHQSRRKTLDRILAEFETFSQ
jgi:hypothetical protein